MKQTKPAQAMELRSLSPVLDGRVESSNRGDEYRSVVNWGLLKSAGGILAAAVLIAACTHLTIEDEQRLRVVKAKFGDRFVFSATDVYLSVQAKGPGVVAQDEWIDVYKTFWFAEGRRRHVTALVYMNVYDASGEWLGQYFWDPRVNQVVFSRRREHY